MTNSISKNKISQYLFSTTTIIIVVISWIIISNITNQTFVFPKLNDIISSLIKILTSSMILMLLKTIMNVLLCLILSSIISFLILALYIYKKNTLSFFTPIITFIRSVPLLGIILFLFLIFSEYTTTYVITIIVVIPLMIEGLINAYDNIDQNVVDALKLEEISFVKKLFKVYIPIIINTYLTTLIQSFGLGLKSMIMAEYLCYSRNSVGASLYDVKFNDSSMLIAWLLIIFVVSFIIEIIFKKLRNIKKEQ